MELSEKQKQLMAECKAKYPIGTIFISKNHLKEIVIDNDDFEFKVYRASDEAIQFKPNKGSQGYFLYYKRKWTKIKSNPKKSVNGNTKGILIEILIKHDDLSEEISNWYYEKPNHPKIDWTLPFLPRTGDLFDIAIIDKKQLHPQHEHDLGYSFKIGTMRWDKNDNGEIYLYMVLESW